VPGAQQLRKLHVLLVDGDLEACEKMDRVLGDGFILRCAINVSEAKKVLQDYRPDVVISEVLLGQESGLDLCRLLRNFPVTRHVPIMLLTALATSSDKIAGFDAGADDYVVKPYDTRQIMARIRLLVRLKRLQHPQD
jgi:DNA-binding response OmpR family regulator